MTLNGIILDFILAPAHQADVVVGEELLWNHHNRIVLGDKGYISAELASSLAEANDVVVLTISRQNQKRQVPRVSISIAYSARRMSCRSST